MESPSQTDLHLRVRQIAQQHLDSLTEELQQCLARCPEPAPDDSGSQKLDGLKAAIEALRTSGSQRELADHLLDAIHGFVPRTALFLVRGGDCTGFGSRGFGGAGAVFQTFTAQPEAAGPLAHILKKRQPQQWPGAVLAASPLMAWLGDTVPATSCLIPLVVGERTVALVYADSGDSESEGFLDQAPVEILTTVAGLSLVPFRPAAAAFPTAATTPAAPHSPGERSAFPPPPLEGAGPAPTLKTQNPAAGGDATVPRPYAETATLPPTPESQEPAEEAATIAPPAPPLPPGDTAAELETTGFEDKSPAGLPLAADEHTQAQDGSGATVQAIDEVLDEVCQPPASCPPDPDEVRTGPQEATGAGLLQIETTDIAPPPGDSHGSSDPEAAVDPAAEDARRFARLLVSEVVLYNEAQVRTGQKQGNLYKLLKEPIDRSRQAYLERFGAGMESQFEAELIRLVALNNKDLMGAGYQPA